MNTNNERDRAIELLEEVVNHWRLGADVPLHLGNDIEEFLSDVAPMLLTDDKLLAFCDANPELVVDICDGQS